MIGNDIVDLELAATQSNWQRKGFLDKIFTKSEQKCILNAKNPFKMVWLLWSMKESAYKSYLQKDPKRFFNPKKLICALKSTNQGTVRINAMVFCTQSEVTKSYIHTVATSNENDFFNADSFETTNDVKIQRKKVYEKLLKKISKIKGISKNTLEIKKDGIGIPKVYNKNVVLSLPVSLSHHGNYAAYTILN